MSEQIGLSIALGRWVMGEAARQIREWLDASLAPPPLSINLSALQFRIPGELERDIAATLSTYRLTPDRMELELTESVLMETSAEHSAALIHLRQKGFRLAIDDFGTGFSSLDYLRRFQVDRIKIDQTFIKDLESTPGNTAIVKATIGLARALDIEVIAEGVETVDQRDLLLTLGCGQMQGFYFARPLPPKAIADRFASGHPLPTP